MAFTQIPYGKQHITDDDISAVVEVLKSDFLTQGPKVAEFETAFAEYIGVKYAVAVANGTAALHLCTLALNVKTGDNVITTPITFAASANCVKYCGGNVYFTDIDKDSFLIDLNKVEELINSKPKGFFQGIIPVDFAGNAVNLEELKKIANKHNLWIIEDACHAPGGYFTDSKGKNQNCGNGNFADLAIFSFHPVKHIATGEGGMITTNNKALYEKLLLLRTHGITKNPDLLTENHGGWYYEMQELGYNYRLTDIQAALGISQLKRASKNLKRRKEIARKYDAVFSNFTLREPQCTENSKFQISNPKSQILNPKSLEGHAFHLYVIQVEKKLELYNYLRTKGIFTQVHYIPVHLQPYYKQLGWKKGDFPVAENYYEHCLSLPMYHSLSNEEQDYVIETILAFYK
ncbi:MAG: UDP-4-amino-4,6-dideoxy-N-acetyl-beta-L-altrosamine transaminase [Bacteroidetes bacterium GWA2_30_7]|nr:MAG: UDP-4-amino-4,6-dideoxy-N-acetyl-beta-L-altrosamine transaminase [Bacteroidetes bacterium GWA2_30_7]